MVYILNMVLPFSIYNLKHDSISIVHPTILAPRHSLQLPGNLNLDHLPRGLCDLRPRWLLSVLRVRLHPPRRKVPSQPKHHRRLLHLLQLRWIMHSMCPRTLLGRTFLQSKLNLWLHQKISQYLSRLWSRALPAERSMLHHYSQLPKLLQFWRVRQLQ